MNPIIFLDIDGVLNGHQYNPAAQSCDIRPECVAMLNKLLAITAADVVLSSAWRYMILGGAMTRIGFEYMMRTHGVARLNIIDITCTDEEISSRGQQILKWLTDHPNERHVVLDDDEFDIRGCGLNHVRTNGKVGLTNADVGMALAYLMPSRLSVETKGGYR